MKEKLERNRWALGINLDRLGSKVFCRGRQLNCHLLQIGGFPFIMHVVLYKVVKFSS